MFAPIATAGLSLLPSDSRIGCIMPNCIPPLASRSSLEGRASRQDLQIESFVLVISSGGRITKASELGPNISRPAFQRGKSGLGVVTPAKGW